MAKQKKTSSLLIRIVIAAAAAVGIAYAVKQKPEPGIKVSITANPVTGKAPLNVTFTATASEGSSPYSYAWNFGDGNVSTLQNPVHTYAAAGNYPAEVTVTDAEGKQANKSIAIVVTDITPSPGKGGIIGIVSDSAIGSPIAGVSITLDGYSGTTDSTGIYSIQNITPGDYSATYSKTGYTSQTVNVTIIADASAEKNISLVAEGAEEVAAQIINVDVS